MPRPPSAGRCLPPSAPSSMPPRPPDCAGSFAFRRATSRIPEHRRGRSPPEGRPCRALGPLLLAHPALRSRTRLHRTRGDRSRWPVLRPPARPARGVRGPVGACRPTAARRDVRALRRIRARTGPAACPVARNPDWRRGKRVERPASAGPRRRGSAVRHSLGGRIIASLRNDLWCRHRRMTAHGRQRDGPSR